MAEEIKGLHIFAELMDGTLHEIEITEEEKALFTAVIGKFYNNTFKISPIGIKIDSLRYLKTPQDDCKS